MTSEEISKIIEDEISALSKSDSLVEIHAPNDRSIRDRLVSPYKEDYTFGGHKDDKESFWTVWDENKDSAEQRYVITFNDRNNTFGIALKPSNVYISQHKDSFIDCLKAL